MKYDKAAIITPKHTAFMWNKSKQQLNIPDEYSNNIKNVYLAKDFTCILNLNNEAVCIEDATDKIVHQQSNVDKIICEELFMCYILIDNNVICKAFEDKQSEIIPKFPNDHKIKDLDIKIREFYGVFEIFQCSFSKSNDVDCFINLAKLDCKDCNSFQKINFGQNIQAVDYIIKYPGYLINNLDYSQFLTICLLDQYFWHCYSAQTYYESQAEWKSFDLKSSIFWFQYQFYPKNIDKQFIDQIWKDSENIYDHLLPLGVQHDIPKSKFADWKILQEAEWSSVTTTSDIEKKVDGDILFVGAQKKSSDKIYMGAYGTKKNIIERTSSVSKSVKRDNDVQWQNQNNLAFGFSDIETINVNNNVDTYDQHNNDNKLSWPLNGYGGQRAGNAVQGQNESEWKKVIQQTKSTSIPNSIPESKSKYTLDQASYGDSYCELGDELEISCQNFPKPINLQRDTIKQSTKKQIEDQIEFYKLKADNDSDDKHEINDNLNDNESIKKLKEGFGKIEIQNKELHKKQVDLQKSKEDEDEKIIQLSILIEKNSKNIDKNNDVSELSFLKQEFDEFKQKIGDLEKQVNDNKSSISAKKPIGDQDMAKIKSELEATKTQLKLDLEADADSFDQKLKDKLVSDDQLNKILELTLENKLSKQDQVEKSNKSLRQMVQALIALVFLLITVNVQLNQIQRKYVTSRHKDEIQVPDTHVDLNLENDPTSNDTYINRLNN